MLRGSSKGIVGENVRALKHRGLSEQEAILVSMKNTKKDKKKSSMMSPCSGSSSEDYPYGLRLILNNESLDKLDMDDMPTVGDTFDVTAKAEVTSTSENSSDGERRRSMDLQITKMRLV